MTGEQLQHFRAWFKAHVATFREADPVHQRSLDLKEEHTARVGEAMDRITAGLGLGENDRRIGATTALFHDLGRFPQYRRYRTFRDSDSVSHSFLGLRELNLHRVLHVLDRPERLLISRAIILHNRLKLPDRLDPATLLHARLIRDADKLDIWRIMVEHFRLPPEERNPVVTLGLDPRGPVREEVLRQVFEKRLINYRELASADEFRVLLLNWVFDVNFLPTLRLFRERNILADLTEGLPESPLLHEALDFVKACVQQRLNATGA